MAIELHPNAKNPASSSQSDRKGAARRVFTALAFLAFFPSVAELAQAQTQDQAQTQSEDIDGQAALLQAQVQEVKSRTAALAAAFNNKIDGRLAQLLLKLDTQDLSNLRPSVSSPISRFAETGALDDDGRVQVLVRASEGAKGLSQALPAAGFTLYGAHERLGLYSGAADSAALQRLTNLPEVASVSLAQKAMVRAGAFQTEGDAIMRSDLVRDSFGLDGTGVRIGILSDYGEGIAQAQASGDLPLGINLYCGDGTNFCTGAEGTALAEIVHDVAPGAQLAICGANTNLLDQRLSFIDCLDTLVDVFQADIVVDDLGFFGEPWFEDGILADEVASRAQQVVLACPH